MIYLDHNATTPPSPGVVEAVNRGLTHVWANPSSVHREGQAARHAVELARASIAALIGSSPREIVFTSGGTEAVHLAIRGVLSAAGAAPVLATARTEHAAVRDLAEEMARAGTPAVRWLAVDRQGRVDLEDVARACADRPTLLSLQWANNETGVIQPIAEVSRIARAAGVLLHCDGTQWVGKMPVAGLGPFDLLTFSPHKFHGPKGVGVLWARRGARVRPQSPGSQELGRRGGTENVPGILGAGAAADEAAAWLGDAAERGRLAGLRDAFERRIVAAIPSAAVNGEGAERLWNTSNIAFPRLEAEALLLALSERGVCASAGAACSSGSLEPSPVLLAMGVPPELAHGSLRFSMSRRTTARELDEAAAAVIDVVRRAQRSSAGLPAPLDGSGGS